MGVMKALLVAEAYVIHFHTDNIEKLKKLIFLVVAVVFFVAAALVECRRIN